MCEVIWLPRGFEFLSGLPEVKRRRRLIVAFQTFIDDSGTKGTGKILLLGGLFGTAEAMASLAERWDMELRARIPLPIAYFKTHEACQLAGEFKDWGRKGRDEKVRRMASVIDRDDLIMVCSSVDIQSHRIMESHIGKLSDSKKHPMNQPYLMAFLSVMFAIGKEMWRRQSNEKVEVVFDEQLTFKADARLQYEMVKEMAPDWLRKFLPAEPIFRDDKDFVVLQAADLLMGNARLHVEKASRWPKLDWDRLKASPFNQPHWARPLAKLTQETIAQRFGVSPDAVPIRWIGDEPPESA